MLSSAESGDKGCNFQCSSQGEGFDWSTSEAILCAIFVPTDLMEDMMVREEIKKTIMKTLKGLSRIMESGAEDKIQANT